MHRAKPPRRNTESLDRASRRGSVALRTGPGCQPRARTTAPSSECGRAVTALGPEQTQPSARERRQDCPLSCRYSSRHLVVLAESPRPSKRRRQIGDHRPLAEERVRCVQADDHPDRRRARKRPTGPIPINPHDRPAMAETRRCPATSTRCCSVASRAVRSPASGSGDRRPQGEVSASRSRAGQLTRCS